MLSSAFISFVFCISTLQTINAQVCSNGLSSPPTITWTPSPLSPDLFSATLTFDVSTKSWNNNTISFTTRLFEDSFGGPTIRMQRGKRYELTFFNNLGPERAENADLSGPQERDPNTTNLHTHGLHISPIEPGDYVFAPVLPGQNNTYIYNIPCTHSGGTHWYHSHVHTSVQLHVGGGAGGAIIIEDDGIGENLPNWYTNMRELIFFINHIDATFINDGFPPRTQAQKDNQLVLNLSPSDEDLYIVNGKYQPSICQTVGEWIKFRFLQTEIRYPQRYQIGDIGQCTLKLLSRDGVIVNNPPRTVSNIVWLAEGSRADVAITCNEGVHSIVALRDNMVIAYIQSEYGDGGVVVAAVDLTPFEPIRPPYLSDLRNVTVDNELSLEVRHNSIAVNNAAPIRFDPNVAIFLEGVDNIGINTVNEWTLQAQDIGASDLWHPTHLHVTHFQVIQGVDGQTPAPFQMDYLPEAGYQEPGDFVDELWGPGIVRFVTDIWGGPLIVHCHQLEHEVTGSLGVILMESGCDNSYNDYNMLGTCSFSADFCDPEPTLEPTANPTMEPTLYPTVNPTVQSSEPSVNPTVEPTKYPSNHPTDIPTLTPSKYPSSYPTRKPTAQPTHIPTVKPTNAPTEYPTFNPSLYPSGVPSKYPIMDPTSNPTRYPSTKFPTSNPTRNPTQNPTQNPTKYPTKYPTQNPTKYPTKNPTKYPTKYPTKFPTKIPTKYPIKNPTQNPTENPTKNPVKNRTKYPTINPTKNSAMNETQRATSEPTLYEPTEPEIFARQLICGDRISGAYNDEILYFKISLPYNGDLICDASDCDFSVQTLTAFQYNGFEISTYSDILHLHNLAIGDYLFSIEGNRNAYGIFSILINCQSINDTPSPTMYNIQSNTILTPTTSTDSDSDSSTLAYTSNTGIYSIIGILSFSLFIIIIFNCITYLRKRHKKTQKNMNKAAKRYSIKSDCVISHDTNISGCGSNDSSPTTGTTGTIISIMDGSPYATQSIQQLQIEAPPPINEWSLPAHTRSKKLLFNNRSDKTNSTYSPSSDSDSAQDKKLQDILNQALARHDDDIIMRKDL